jgi:hypothetical protein
MPMVVAWNSNTTAFMPASGWEDAAGITGARGWGEMRCRNGNITATPAVQFANDPRNPDATATGVGSTLSADGVSDPNGITALSSTTKKLARAGWNLSLTSGTVLSTAWVSGAVDLIRN